MKLLFFLCVFLASGFLPSNAFAGDINWSGLYRVESVYLRNPALESGYPSDKYLDQHLIVSPEFIAADGLSIHTRFDIFNNPYSPGSQFGEFFGGANSSTANTGTTGLLPPAKMSISDLYLTWNQQFGSFIAGRAPIQFGLGITYNAGNGEFDHWLDRRDMVGYKFVMGNFSFFPMYGKVKEGDIQQDQGISDYMFQASYENLDTGLEIGFFFDNRRASGSANDLTTTGVALPNGGTGYLFNRAVAVSKGELDIKTYNIFVRKTNGPISIGLESSMQGGRTGLNSTSTQEEIDLGTFALAGEFNYKPDTSNWNYNVKFGTMTGDDPSNQAKYSGYLVNKNYDVALILFNYILGDPSASSLGNENYVRSTTLSQGQKFDVSQLTNAIYFSPGTQWKWSDKWGMTSQLTWATLNRTQYQGQSKDLGEELDLGLYYNPLERFHIRFDMGYLWSGAAFKSNPNFQNKSIFGCMTRAALSF